MVDDDGNSSKPAEHRDSCPSTDGMLELDNLTLLDTTTSTTTTMNPKNNDAAHSTPLTPPLADNDENDDDSSDDDNEEGISSSYHHNHNPTSSSSQQQQVTHLLGQTFNTHSPSYTHHSTLTFQKSLYLFTYRNDLVVPLRPYAATTNAQSLVGNITHGGGLSGVTGEGGMKSDAGWGCMLRSAQMLFCEAVRRHYTAAVDDFDDGREEGAAAKYDKSGTRLQSGSKQLLHRVHNHRAAVAVGGSQRGRKVKQPEDPWEVERIANWFADFPNHADNDIGSMNDVNVVDVDNGTASKNGANEATEDETGAGATLTNNLESKSVQDTHNANKAKEGMISDNETYGKGGLSYHWYSLHQMVAAGLGLGVLPGEWYGPTTACHVLRELNEMHCEKRERLAKTLNNNGNATSEFKQECKCDMFRVHIATEGCVYLDAISKLMTRCCSGDDELVVENKDVRDDDEVKDAIFIDDPLALPTDHIDDPLRVMPQQTPIAAVKPLEQWDTALLLLLPLRLGIQSISTAQYGSTLAKLLAFPQSVGMLGGTPRHALWFYGADAVGTPNSSENDNDTTQQQGGDAGGWYGLDPHTVQLAPRGTQVLLEPISIEDDVNETTSSKPKLRWQVQLTESYLRSLHLSPTTSTHPNHNKSIPLSGLDPSCALGFYIRDSADFVHFQSLLKELKDEHCKPNKLPEVVTVQEKTPDYQVDLCGVMKSLTGKGSGEDGGVAGVDDIDGFSMHSEEEEVHDENEEDDDDDDFVLI